MKKLIILLALLSPFVYANGFETIGTVRESDIYRNITDTKELQGRLQLLIMNSSETNGRKIYNAPTYEVIINGKSIAKISQNTSDIAFQNGIFKFLRLDLPTGKYTAQIRQNTLFNSGVKKDFDFIIQEGKSLPIIFENFELSKLDRIPIVIGNNLSAKAEAEIDSVAYGLLVEEASKDAIGFNSQVQNYRLEAEKARAAKAEEDKKIAAQWYKERDERLKRIEEEKQKALIAEEEKKKIAEAEKEAQAKQAIETINKEDDATCKSFGAKFGTEPYVACRLALKKARDEQREREITNAKMRENLEEIKQQNLRQQLQREYENQKAEEKRQSDLAIYQQRLAEEQRRRERAERLDAAQRAFEAAARLSQPVPGTPINSIPQIPLPQRTTCFRNGNYVDCRTQ